jgi:hypothetical protein
MRTRTKSSFGLTAVLCLLLAGLGTFSFADVEVEETRITLGSGESEKGRFKVSDSITQSVGVGVQQGSSRVEVTNVKQQSETTDVKDWEDYR